MVHNKLGSRGDTIIEVLIAIAIVTSVLGTAYSMMNRNMLVVQDNRERAEASGLAQGQIELLRRGHYSNPGPGFNLSLVSFCIDSNLVTHTSNNDSCLHRSLYRYFLTKNNNGSYTVTVEWDSLGGGKGSVVMAYRLD